LRGVWRARRGGLSIALTKFWRIFIGPSGNKEEAILKLEVFATQRFCGVLMHEQSDHQPRGTDSLPQYSVWLCGSAQIRTTSRHLGCNMFSLASMCSRTSLWRSGPPQSRTSRIVMLQGRSMAYISTSHIASKSPHSSSEHSTVTAPRNHAHKQHCLY
jgi:hypothetical protein